jgi:hypothetical protein
MSGGPGSLAVSPDGALPCRRWAVEPRERLLRCAAAAAWPMRGVSGVHVSGGADGGSIAEFMRRLRRSRGHRPGWRGWLPAERRHCRRGAASSLPPSGAGTVLSSPAGSGYVALARRDFVSGAVGVRRGAERRARPTFPRSWAAGRRSWRFEAGRRRAGGVRSRPGCGCVANRRAAPGGCAAVPQPAGRDRSGARGAAADGTPGRCAYGRTSGRLGLRPESRVPVPRACTWWSAGRGTRCRARAFPPGVGAGSVRRRIARPRSARFSSSGRTLQARRRRTGGRRTSSRRRNWRRALRALAERERDAALPAEFRAIASAAQASRGDLAALIGVRLDDVLRSAPARQIVVTDTRGSLGGGVDYGRLPRQASSSPSPTTRSSRAIDR